MLGALIGEAAADTELASALHDRIVAPRRPSSPARLARGRPRLLVPIDTAADLIARPLYHRALIVGEPIDERFINSVVSATIDPGPEAPEA